MPTRSIALQLDLTDPVHASALWQTHRLMNEKARWFLQELLVLRGDEVWTEDVVLARSMGHPGQEKNEHGLFVVSKPMAQERLRERIKLLKPTLTPEAIGKAAQGLAALYDLVIPSHLDGEEGDAQSANRLMGILLDPGSEGGLGAIAKAEAPTWVDAMSKEAAGWEAAAEAWRVTTLAATRPTGRQPRWRGLAEKADPEWLLAYLEDLEKNQKKAGAGGEATLLAQLKKDGLLPVWPAYQTVKAMIGGEERGYLSKWDRLAFKLAVSRLLSWESWNHRARKEHETRQLALSSALDALSAFPGTVTQLRAYELERTRDLRATNQLAKDDTDFRLGGRQIRKWEALSRALRRATVGTDLLQVVAEFQAINPRESPDPYFSEWVLASPARQDLWATDEGVRAVQLLAKANRLEFIARKSRERTAMTPPDARLHPIWLQFEEPSGSNLKNLNLVRNAEGDWFAALDLIHQQDGGPREEKAFKIPLRPSAQLAIQSVEKLNKKEGGPGKTPVITFIQAPSRGRVEDRRGTETWTATMQSPDILLDRAILEANPDAAFDPAHLRANLKLVLDLEPQLVEGQGIATVTPSGTRWSRIPAPKWAYHLQSSLAEASKHEAELAEGHRFLSVDLGVRDLAAVALFELHKGRLKSGEEGFAIPASSPWKALLVEGSIRTLSLPGELADIDADTLSRRREAEDALRLMKFLKIRRTRLLALAHPATPASARSKALDGLMRKVKDPAAQARAREDQNRHATALALLLADDDPPQARGDRASERKQATRPANVNAAFRAPLQQAAGLDPRPDISTVPAAQATLGAWDEAIAELVQTWRARTRRRDPRKSGLHGKSLWAIEHLGSVRDFLKGWHRRGQMSGEINRPGRDFAKTLLEHINQLKDDRTKEGANLLTNTARGLVYDPSSHQWTKQFEPAHLILFEDLTRYRFFTDRPRFENSQLMRWTHRELTKVVQQMAQLFGIGVLDTGAAFSSRFHGLSGTPGLRAKVFTENELRADWFQNRWKESWQPAPGVPLPWDGGKTFFTLDAHGKLESLDADHNAALSLARRFANRNGEPIRLVCTGMKDGTFVPSNLGKRLLGGLRGADPKDKGYGHLVPCTGAPAFAWEPLTQSQWEKLAGAKVAKQDESQAVPEDDADALEEAMEQAEAESESVEGVGAGKKVVFFRDPSGTFFPANHWLPGDVFWGSVRKSITKAMRQLHEAQQPF